VNTDVLEEDPDRTYQEKIVLMVLSMMIAPDKWDLFTHLKYKIVKCLRPGRNRIAIDVAIKLERELAAGKRSILELMQARKVKDPPASQAL
jgi:hypothetical protein